MHVGNIWLPIGMWHLTLYNSMFYLVPSDCPLLNSRVTLYLQINLLEWIGVCSYAFVFANVEPILACDDAYALHSDGTFVQNLMIREN